MIGAADGTARRSPWSEARLHRAAGRARPARITLRHAGWLTLGASLGLIALGISSINLTAGVGADGMGAFARRQLMFVPVGLLAAAITATPHFRWIGRWSGPLAGLSLASLLFVLLPVAPDWLVTPRNGARRWINLGVADVQPSELAKITYVLLLARYLRFRKNYRTLRGLAPPLLLTFLPMGLIVVEPDLGTALLFLPTLFAVLIAAGARLKHLALLILAASLLAPAMYPILKPHQRARVHAMWNQLRGDRSTADTINYQGFQAITLIGAGGVTGLDADLSRAVVDSNNLPEDHNDMIFAVIVNRLGLLGAALTIALYLAWVAGALLVAGACKDPFGRLVAVGLAAMVGSQAFINIAMTVGLAPITGMTLPFVSYGGSSLVAALIMTGLVVNIAMRRPAYLSRRSFEFRAEGA
ncbi:MAG: hypothetical protein D6693_01675 [Planctomycetota bacterium]|nr:MAG: hypothetical protein D6693_01675 [Planctomycetota bacterium]